MSYGSLAPFTATMASGATLTSEVDLGAGWTTAYIEIPSMTSNTAICIQAANASGGTYRRVKHPTINSSTVTTNDFMIASAATSCFVPIPGGLRYIKVETTATVDGGCTFRVLCN